MADPVLPPPALPPPALPLPACAPNPSQLAPNPPPPLPFIFLSSQSRHRPCSSFPPKPPRPLPSQIRRIPCHLGGRDVPQGGAARRRHGNMRRRRRPREGPWRWHREGPQWWLGEGPRRQHNDRRRRRRRRRHFAGCSSSAGCCSSACCIFSGGTSPMLARICSFNGAAPKFFPTWKPVLKSMASAWLNTSKDPIHGNEKKSGSFWSQITKEFNQNKQREYHRDTNSLKIHWTRLSKMINEFNGYWISVCKMNKSGYSDDQLMDEAQKRYEKKNEKHFTLIHWWKILKDEPKWCTFVAQSEKDKSKKSSQAIDGDDIAEQRPIGRESAKQERRGKRKVDQVMDGIEILGENINKIVEVTQERKKEREQTTEAQLEISTMNLQTAKEHKEAKLLEAYTSLLARDTSQMSAEEKISHGKTLLKMEKMIFQND
ncbi:glutathione S-transferase T3-like isoform X2 [Panicum virgatum]|uniref:glutathione S-transferase T3-like isoform X2 n=1 Tax=Panicum virgatum TaxID=38727 RepID=UPI0019D50A74|nr:glutathione S-transferase T3-like isoform X2 [Panicum virgatum]